MEAIIKFDFLQLFLYKEEINEDDLIDTDWGNLTEWKKGDEVEIIRIVESLDFKGGKSYVIYNPKNYKSITVGSHVIDFIK